MTEVPETHVLAIASHVSYGYVGNTMATFVMQSLGCEVSAINTVAYSNHVAYRVFKGRKTTAEEVAELYQGLKQAKLNGFDMMLSGYCPSAAIVEEVGKIARDIRLRHSTRPGSFFWVLDPVMGDNGRLYVAEDVVPAYKSLLKDADLIVPNQFEAELLSEIKIHDLQTLMTAIATLHMKYQLPHVVITSISLPPTTINTSTDGSSESSARLSIFGSTATADYKPRPFLLTVPALSAFFSGTGDMFASLTVVRLRQAAQEANLLDKASWRSPDSVSPTDLPLAKACERVLASMHAVLKSTAVQYDKVANQLRGEEELRQGHGKEEGEAMVMERHLKLTRAAEVRVVRNSQALREPPDLDNFKAQAVEVESKSPEAELDNAGAVNVGNGDGAVHQT